MRLIMPLTVNQFFPSKYLKAHDLQGREVKHKISHATSERINDQEKLVIYFVGHQKGLVLNKTNAKTIALKYGINAESWSGAEVVLYPAMVDFRGTPTESIRIKTPNLTAVPRANRDVPTPVEHMPDGPEDPDDEIPFEEE